jgi:nitrite reductase/ring-hydroxylating ferredoxin subunit
MSDAPTEQTEQAQQAEQGQQAEQPTAIAYAICGFNEIPSQKAKGFKLSRIDDDGTERAFNIVIIRWGKQVFGYINRCPHDGVNLDWERNSFLDSNGIRLQCGKHGALFELGTGMCIEGPPKGRCLQPVHLQVMDGDICVLGVTLAEEEDDDDDDDGPAPDDP